MPSSSCWKPSNSNNITSTPEIFAWGRNLQIFAATPLPQSVSISSLPTHAYIVKVSDGSNHCLALDNLGNVYAQGSNQRGQLGDGTITSHGNFLPINISALPPGIKFKDIAAGGVVSVILSTTGQIYTFGDNFNGALGIGTFGGFSTVPVPVITSGVLSGKNIVKITIGSQSVAVIDDHGIVYTWGYGVSGKLGNGTFVNSAVPVQVLTATRYRDVAVGAVTVIAITTDGTLNTWGDGNEGTLGNGGTSNSNIPVAVVGVTGKQFISVTMSAYAAGAVTTTGEVYTWGRNVNGTLGQGIANTLTVVLTPQRVLGIIAGVPMKSIVSPGMLQYYMMTLSETGQVYSWGENVQGYLGNGTFVNSNVPTGAIAGLLVDKIVTQISAGLQASALTQ